METEITALKISNKCWKNCFDELVKLVTRQRKIINEYEEKYGKLEKDD